MEYEPATGSLTQATYERIRLDILECRLRPAERLKIGDICNALSVSLGAVREALSRLTSEGLVTAEPQRGFRVAPISAADFEDCAHTRSEIEQLCLRTAIARGDLAWEAHVVAAFHRLIGTPREPDIRTGQPDEAWAYAHEDFHEALASACGSPRLLAIRHLQHLHYERYRRHALPFTDRLRLDEIDRDHRALTDAAVARDTDRALAIMARHIDSTSVTLRAGLEASGLLARPAGTAGSPRPRRRPVRELAAAPAV
jgi:DNA-binding GntR family transcriptional regulator